MRPSPDNPGPEPAELLEACPAALDEALSLVSWRTIAEIDEDGFRAVNELGGLPRSVPHAYAREHCGEQRT